MSIIQFLRILWARRWIIAAATVSCIVGAVIVVKVLPPRWEAHSRVMLDLIKPDPLTGQALGASSRIYAATQIELVKDYAVAGKVADELGWLSDPALIERYRNRPASDARDFRRWIAQQVIDRTDAKIVEGSNILEITYTATTPQDAKGVADALMKAYIDSSVSFRRDEAKRNADWFDEQGQKEQAQLNVAAQAEADYQRQTGLILQDDKTDVDSARLRALAASSGPVIGAATQVGPSSTGELAQLDATISQESQTLGPNHPELLALKAKRAALASQIAQDRANAKAGAASSGAGALTAAMNAAVAAEKSKVMSQSDKIERLKQLRAEVELRRDEYNKTASKAAELRQEATIGETGLTLLGAAVTPQSPKFPNKPLIFGGAVGLGLATGVLVALLVELFDRRVRGVEDLKVIGAPTLAIVPTNARMVARPKPVRVRDLKDSSRRLRRRDGVAHA